MPAAGEVAGGPARLRAKALLGAAIDEAAATLTHRVLQVVEARLVNGSGSFALDEAVLTGVRRCRFEPALRDGVPVFGSLDYRVVFRLE